MFNKILGSYGFDGMAQLAESMIPTSRYGMSACSVAASVGIGAVTNWLGISPLIVVAMFLVVIVEMITGIRASKAEGRKFESFRFSRGILKICVWCIIFFVFHAFAIEMSRFQGWVYVIATSMFEILHASAMVWFVIENTTSILENQAVIDGRDKTEYIDAVKSIWSRFIEVIKGKMK